MEAARAAVVDRAPAVSVGPVATPGWDPPSACATLQGAERAEPGGGLSPPDSPVGSPHPLSALGLVGDTSPSSGTVSYGVSSCASKTQRAGASSPFPRPCHRADAWHWEGTVPVGRDVLAEQPWPQAGYSRARHVFAARTSSAFPPAAFHPHPTWSGTPHGRPRI